MDKDFVNKNSGRDTRDFYDFGENFKPASKAYLDAVMPDHVKARIKQVEAERAAEKQAAE